LASPVRRPLQVDAAESNAAWSFKVRKTAAWDSVEYLNALPEKGRSSTPDYLVELRGFEPMAIAGAVRSRAIPPFAGQCAQPARRPRLLDCDRRPRLGCSPLALLAGVAEVASAECREALALIGPSLLHARALVVAPRRAEAERADRIRHIEHVGRVELTSRASSRGTYTR
jgi:hypothetical protein